MLGLESGAILYEAVLWSFEDTSVTLLLSCSHLKYFSPPFQFPTPKCTVMSAYFTWSGEQMGPRVAGKPTVNKAAMGHVAPGSR